MQIRPRSTAIRNRQSFLFLDHGRIEVRDGGVVCVQSDGSLLQVPVGAISCLALEPGTTVTHAAVAKASEAGCLLVWVGEAGVRLYAAGQPGGASARHLLFQAATALDDQARLKVVRRMFEIRFGQAPANRSIDQLRGLEGVRVRKMYKALADRAGISWTQRNYDQSNWSSADPANRAMSCATSCLYGLVEAAVLAAGYAPSIGFLHKGSARAFVYDIADLYKFETVVPVAFHEARRGGANLERRVRTGCRDSFRSSKLVSTIIPAIHDVLSAGGLSMPEESEAAEGSQISEARIDGDAGHRS